VTSEERLRLRLAVEDFQNEEILLLQAGRYRAWLALLTEDVKYWMPVVAVRASREEMVSRPGDIAWFDDNLRTLTLRVDRFETGQAVEESIPARLRYFVTNISIEECDEGEVDVESNLIVYRTRRERQEGFFVGGRSDVLRWDDGRLKLARRTIVLDKNVRGIDSHMGIFF
jgi:3-phenylpropionate/cinnamic acid dioxygenase small subunit